MNFKIVFNRRAGFSKTLTSILPEQFFQSSDQYLYILLYLYNIRKKIFKIVFNLNYNWILNIINYFKILSA